MNIKTEGSKVTLEFEVTDEMREGLRNFADDHGLAHPPIEHEVGIVAALMGRMFAAELTYFRNWLACEYGAAIEVIMTWDA